MYQDLEDLNNLEEELLQSLDEDSEEPAEYDEATGDRLEDIQEELSPFLHYDEESDDGDDY